jgi:hypothetical protein
MKYIVNYLLRRFVAKDLPKHVGRWKVEYCDKKINSKIDLSNEDHCGPCGQYAKLKEEMVDKEKEKYLPDK